jgi:predicted transcriptional regulator
MRWFAQILKTIAETYALDLFKTIAQSSLRDRRAKNTSTLRKSLKLTRRQYYHRMSGLVSAGLVRRKEGKYHLTTYGKLVYECLTIMESGLKEMSMLNAIDTIRTSDKMTEPDLTKITDNLIHNQVIKQLVLKK